ncbi:MAG TPA: Rrf2 family transcriptional regulator [Patescibacteria group bacterium]|nr:Rrf2 family transcriptional regulator [Patescibacteria group bacterium]
MNASKRRLFAEPLFAALEVLLEVARQTETERVVPVPKIAAALNISVSYVEKLARDLGRAGLIKAERGVYGGFRLNKPLEEISVAAVADAVDVGPPNEDVSGSRAQAQNLRGQLAPYNQRVLARITVADVVKTNLDEYKIFEK